MSVSIVLGSANGYMLAGSGRCKRSMLCRLSGGMEPGGGAEPFNCLYA